MSNRKNCEITKHNLMLNYHKNYLLRSLLFSQISLWLPLSWISVLLESFFIVRSYSALNRENWKTSPKSINVFVCFIVDLNSIFPCLSKTKHIEFFESTKLHQSFSVKWRKKHIPSITVLILQALTGVAPKITLLVYTKWKVFLF